MLEPINSRRFNMRDLTNAVVRFSWSLPLFGMKQMLNFVTSGRGTAAALNEVSDAARRHLGETMGDLASNLEKTQNRISDAIFRRSCRDGDGDQRERRQQGWGPIPRDRYSDSPGT